MVPENPPLGVGPHWYVYPQRIIDLLEAASRYAKYSLSHTATRTVAEDYRMISQWAKEIERLSDLMVELEERKCKTKSGLT